MNEYEVEYHYQVGESIKFHKAVVSVKADDEEAVERHVKDLAMIRHNAKYVRVGSITNLSERKFNPFEPKNGG